MNNVHHQRRTSTKLIFIHLLQPLHEIVLLDLVSQDKVPKLHIFMHRQSCFHYPNTYMCISFVLHLGQRHSSLPGNINESTNNTRSQLSRASSLVKHFLRILQHDVVSNLLMWTAIFFGLIDSKASVSIFALFSLQMARPFPSECECAMQHTVFGWSCHLKAEFKLDSASFAARRNWIFDRVIGSFNVALQQNVP